MRASTPSDTTQRRRPRKGSIATLIALLALAGVAQVLAPASAGAMVDQNLGTCTRITGDLGWNYATDKPCTVSGGGGAVAIPGTGRPGEVVVIEDTAPPEDVIPCLDPRLCVPPREGPKDSKPSKDVLHDKQTQPGPKAGKVEVKKPPKPKPMTEAEKKIACGRVFDQLEDPGNGYKGIGFFWQALQDLKKDYKHNKKKWRDLGHTVDATNFDDTPVVAEVNKTYRERQALLARWDGLECADRLEKKLDPRLRT